MNRKIIAAAGLLIAGLATATAAEATNFRQAQAPNAVLDVNPNVLVPLSYPVSCVVQGTPVEFPSDVLIRNTGAFTIPAGKWVQWYLHNQANGWYQLSDPLASNDAVFLSDVIPGGWPAGATCSAEVQ